MRRRSSFFRQAPIRRTHARVLRSGALMFAAIVSVAPLGARAGCTIETIEMPVKMAGSRAIATVGINGTSVPLTVDSGAFFSFLTDAAAEQLNLTLKKNTAFRVEGITGRVETRMTRVERLRLFKGEIKGVDFVVGGNEPGAGTMGLMGRNILSFTDTEYDLAHGAIRFHFPNDECANSGMAYWAGTTPVTELELLPDHSTKRPEIRANVKLNGKSVVAMFDTGATTIVALKTARRAGVAESNLEPSLAVYGVGRGSAKSYIAAFEKFEIDGEVIRNNRLRVGDFELDDSDMILGIDFFLAHRIYVSKGQSRMFVTYNGGPVFSLDRVETAGTDGASGEPASNPRVQPTTADQFARRGSASAARRDYASALADLDRACELEPGSAAFFTQRASIQLALGRPAKALEDLDVALRLDATQADARYDRAALRLGLKDRDGAQADLDALDRMLAPQAHMRLPMSNLYLGLDQPAQAIAQLDRWLPAHPHEVERERAFNNRCWARVMLGSELAQALDDCDEAVDGDAKNASYLDSRGWVYVRQGKYGKAIADFDRSIALEASASSLYGRGVAKRRLGQTAQGDADLAAARAKEPEVEVRMSRVGLGPDGATKP